MEFYGNSMLYNHLGKYDPTGDDGEDYYMEYSLDYPKETTYVQCQTCKHYVHPTHGVIDQRINEFFCNECDAEHQKHHAND
jgi:hypothetical protein